MSQLLTHTETGFNPHYLAYAIAHGATSAEEMLERDRERWPVGIMAGFICWIREQWAAWRDERGYGSNTPLSAADHREFDAWLADRVIACPSPLTTTPQ